MLTVGEILKKEREKKGVTLQDIEKEIRIRDKFLKAIENNQWDIFSSKVYIAGVIKSYSKFLGIDSQRTLAFFYRDFEKNEEIKFKTKVAAGYLTSEVKKRFYAILLIIFGLFFVYFGYQLKLYLTPPKIILISPQVNVFKKENVVKLVGKTEKEAVVTVAGERVYQNNDGIFEFNFPLKPGKNLVVIEAIGANGKKTIFKKELIRQGKINR